MSEEKQVGKKDVRKLRGLDIVALQYAEGGAMGEPGGVYFVTSGKEVYHTNYLYSVSESDDRKKMSLKDLEKIFPPLRDFSYGLAGHGVTAPAAWHHEYLGFGNHLLLKESLRERFSARAAELLEQYPDRILYNLWLTTVLEILD